MRAIQSSDERERKQERNRKIITFILLGLLLVSSAGYAFISYQDNAQNEPSKDTPTPDGRWQTSLEGTTLTFRNSPSSVVSIPVQLNTPQLYSGQTRVYVSADSEAILSELGSTLGKSVSLTPACYGSCSQNLPEKNCSYPLIVWNASDQNRVYQRDQCVFIEGDLRAVDAFIFKVLNIG